MPAREWKYDGRRADGETTLQRMHDELVRRNYAATASDLANLFRLWQHPYRRIRSEAASRLAALLTLADVNVLLERLNAQPNSSEADTLMELHTCGVTVDTVPVYARGPPVRRCRSV